MNRITLVLLLVVSLGSAKTIETEDELRAIERAHVAVKEIEASFRKALEENHCRTEKSGKSVLRVGRTSERLRNPKNQPPEWAKTYLPEVSQSRKGRLVKIGIDRFGYLEPIFTEAICLNCHGTKLEKSVQQSIRESYPGDKAIGYGVGDIRGVLWLEMTKE